MAVAAQIDTTKDTGLITGHELKGKKYVKSKYPIMKGITTYRLDDVIEEGWQKLSDHYGVDMKSFAKSEGYI